MALGQRKVLLYTAAAALRLLLFLGFPSLTDFLAGRVEISTPVTGFKRCTLCSSDAVPFTSSANLLPVQEGLFLYTHNVSPYDGGVFYQVRVPRAGCSSGHILTSQAPLLLPLFSLLPTAVFQTVAQLLYILLDLLCAHALARIAESEQSGNERLFKSPRKYARWESSALGAAYGFMCELY